MWALCLGTLVAGTLTALMIPFLPFVTAVGLASVLGAVVAAVRGEFALPILVHAAMLVICAQVGYALGMAGQVFTVGDQSHKVAPDLGDRGSAEALGSLGTEEK